MNDKIKYFIPKYLNRFASEKNRIWEYVPVEKISLRGLGRVPSKGEFVKRLQEMLGTFTPEFFADIKTEDKETIIRCADQTLNHDFDLLGSGLMHLGSIPWHTDFKSGYTWPKGVFYRYQRGKTPKGSDIKVPWELSRCHHLLWLGEAYLITADEKYAKEVVDEINNWLDENPLMYSVNWTCSMDIAIRAVNWMYALNFISSSDFLTDVFLHKLYKSLYQHGFFISNCLERTYPYSNNHYFSDLVGLLYLGVLYKSTFRGRRWFRYALKHYKQEVKIETMPSGVNFEKSVSYHRLMTELIVFPYSMMSRCGFSFDRVILERIRKAVSYIYNYSNDNGLSPVVADNDDGRFLPFVYRDFRKHGYLASKDSLEMRIAFNSIEDISVLEIETKMTRLYSDANVAILRSGDSYLFTSCCDRWRYDINTGNLMSAHLHNDLFSFVYSIGEQEIVVDPGSYLYTSNIDKRNEFRSAKKHSTIVVDDEEQNLLAESDAFSFVYNTIAKPLIASSIGDEAHCDGEYSTILGHLTHNRSFDLNADTLVIKDVLGKQGLKHRAYLSFHLAEGISVTEFGKDFELSYKDRVIRLEFETQQKISTRVIDDTISPSYGVLVPSKTIVVFFDFDEKTEIITKFKIIQ